MKRVLPDILLCLILAAFMAVHFSVGFSRIAYIVRESVEGPTLQSMSGTHPDRCEDESIGPDRMPEAEACYRPFVDPRGHLEAETRPQGHSVFLIAFLVSSVCLSAAVLYMWRRRIAEWLRAFRAYPGPEPRPGRRELAVLAAVFGTAVFTRVYGIGTWVVEESEWGAVESLPIADLLFHGRETQHEPPLFTALQHVVYMINDTSLAWTRSLTCLTGILLVAAVWRSSRSIFGPRTAILAAALAAVHPAMVSNAHVMRPYSLAAFFVVMALPHAFRLGSGGRWRDVAALSLFGGFAIWTHYTSLMSLFVMFVYMVARLPSAWRERPVLLERIGKIAVAALALLVFFLPFIPFFFSDFSDKQGSWVSPEFVDDMLAAVTGVPFGFGWIPVAFPLVTGLRRARSGRFLLFFATGFVLLMASTVWMVWWEPTHAAILAPVLTMMFAASAVRLFPDRKSRAPALFAAPWFAAMAVMTGILFGLPSDSPTVWNAARPMTWHGMSYQIQAQKIVDLMKSAPQTYDCENLFMTPSDQISGFMYYWGPVTPAQIGMKPIESSNFETFSMNVDVGGRTKSMNLTPVERLWSWEKGQWLDLEMALREKGCLWYQKSYQNCRLGTGRFYSSNDCRWLKDNCETVSSMPDAELFFCTRKNGAAQQKIEK